MNKKIYFNNKFLLFAPQAPQKSQDQTIIQHGATTAPELKKVMTWLLSEDRSSKSQNNIMVLPPESFEQVIDYLKKKYYYIEAAGGLIQKKDRYLFIFRLGRWDLPKGKLDKGETPEHAAVRECEEECAIGELSISHQLSSTFHIYPYKDSFAIKQTFWYMMTSTWENKLVPQKEENIERAEWLDKKEISETVFANSYYTIKDVVNEGLRLL